MSRKQRKGKMIGGFGAAVLLGLCGIFSKLAFDAGLSSTLYLVCAGVGIILRGGIPQLIWRTEQNCNANSVFYAFLSGIAWGSASCLVGIAIIKYEMPISVLSPLYNANALVPVLGGILFFKEKVYWKKVLLGTACAIGTGFIFAYAQKDSTAEAAANHNVGLLLGGLAAGIYYGVFAIFLKKSFQEGIAGSAYIAWTGVGIAISGVVGTLLITRSWSCNAQGVAWAILNGVVWGTACHCIGLAVDKYKTPMAVLAPLYNLNTIVPVVAGVLLFREHVSWHLLVVGTSLTLLSGYILVKSQIPEDDTTQMEALALRK